MDIFEVPVPAIRFSKIKTEAKHITMADGTLIAVDVLLPAQLSEQEKIPTVMVMTRYWRSFELRIPGPPGKAPIAPREKIADDLVLRGFAMVVVDARGSGASTGSSNYPWSATELSDYAEVADWILKQAWSNGRIGSLGTSYEGTNALLLSTVGNQAVQAVVPHQIELDVYTDIAFPGGIFNRAFIAAWSEGNQLLDSNRLPKWFPIPAFVRVLLRGVRPVDADNSSRKLLAQALREHEANTDIFAAMAQITYRDDPFGNTGVTCDDFSPFTHRHMIEDSGNTLFTWGSWLDSATADSVINLFNTLRNPQIAVIGAWSHDKSTSASPYGSTKAKPNPDVSAQWALLAQFFELTLQKDAPPLGKKLYYYTLGEELWKETTEFPLHNTEVQTWFLGEKNEIGLAAPVAEDACDKYVVDFSATTGKYNRWQTGLAKPVIYGDRAAADRRLLSYTSQRLEKEIEITGYPCVSLYIASSADDGVVYVYLEDVDSSGKVRYLTEGMLRFMHRQTSGVANSTVISNIQRTFKRSDSLPVVPEEPMEIKLNLLPVSVLIKAGSRLRLAIAGADSDTFVRLPSQSTPILTVYRQAGMASCLYLPIVPR